VNSSVPGNDTYPTGSVFTKLTNPTNGVVTFNSNGTFNYNPNSGFTGVDVFTYQVCLPAPNGTLCDPATVTIVVGPLANDDVATTPHNTPVTADVKVNDTYPSGAVFNNTSNPLNGSLVFSSNGTYTYTPAPGFTGVDQFTYTVCLPAPNGTLCDPATVTIVVGPIAEDDSYTTPYDTDVNSSVPGNDTYPTGSVFTKLTNPTNGVVTFNSNGTFNYNPNSGFTGVDVFTYQVCLPAPNGTLCDPATVTIVVGPLANDDVATTPHNTPVTADVKGNDTYPSGAVFNNTSNPSNGSLVFSSNGTYTYTPAPGFTGVDQFTYTVCLPAPNGTVCDAATVTIVVGPIAEDDSYTTPYDTDVNSSVPGNDTYPTGSVFTKLTNPANGVVTFNPDGTFNYNPNAGFTGVDVFTYQVCLPAPNGTLCDPATVTIVVGPLANDDDETTPHNTPVTADVKGNDTYPSGAVFNNTSNPSNGSLVFSSNGTYTYTPAPGFTGVDQFTYTVCLPAAERHAMRSGYGDDCGWSDCRRRQLHHAIRYGCEQLRTRQRYVPDRLSIHEVDQSNQRGSDIQLERHVQLQSECRLHGCGCIYLSGMSSGTERHAVRSCNGDDCGWSAGE
jgi:hypothetical protein